MDLQEQKDKPKEEPDADLDKYDMGERPIQIKSNTPVTLEPSTHKHDVPIIKPGPDGDVDWAPLAVFAGTRPQVSKHVINRYSVGEWKKNNYKLTNSDMLTHSNEVDYNAKTSMMQTFGNIDKLRFENDTRIKQKAKDLFRWKAEVEKACKMITNEVELLEMERERLKGASRVLMLPEAISRECLELRSNRTIPDLVADLAEEQLIKEMNLIAEVRATLSTTLKKIEEQLTITRAAKHRIEFDWCDKTMAYDTETANLDLNTKSTTITFKPGSTRYGEYSAPLDDWEFFCRQNIENCEAVRQQSVDLRGSLNGILVSNGAKLRAQADKTNKALAENVALTTEICYRLEKDLKDTLQCIADTEKNINNLQDAIKKSDAAMKLAQTRLDNRNNNRPHGEAVKDVPHINLICEVKVIHETVTMLRGQLSSAEKARTDLMNRRNELQTSIASKRKTLNIDRERCGRVRIHYPSAAVLAGF